MISRSVNISRCMNVPPSGRRWGAALGGEQVSRARAERRSITTCTPREGVANGNCNKRQSKATLRERRYKRINKKNTACSWNTIDEPSCERMERFKPNMHSSPFLVASWTANDSRQPQMSGYHRIPFKRNRLYHSGWNAHFPINCCLENELGINTCPFHCWRWTWNCQHSLVIFTTKTTSNNSVWPSFKLFETEKFCACSIKEMKMLWSPLPKRQGRWDWHQLSLQIGFEQLSRAGAENFSETRN